MTPEMDKQALFVTSCLNETAGQWQTAREYSQSRLIISPRGFSSATNVLLTQPNLNSSHLFRADILYDTAKRLKTPAELERDRGLPAGAEESDEDVASGTPEIFSGFNHSRTVVRRLIPRNQQLDQTLVQSCHVYEAGASKHLVVYRPHTNSPEATPWYHPPVRALAYLYEVDSAPDQGLSNASVSVHVLPFGVSPPGSTIPTRLHRTLLSLLHTLTRLSKSMSRSAGDTPKTAMTPKDNIIPQHVVQNTYSRLKQTYAANLISRWVEKTEPSKHVFEDLSIAAFLIELWRQMYDVSPTCERSASASCRAFPGFVDIACGNGVLTYVLRKEGYEGWGFDARRRRTWEVLPGNMQEHLLERVLVPEPYLRATLQPLRQGKIDALPHQVTKSLAGLEYHTGIFNPGTFIISNHADELTPWTPILAAMSCPADPLPWLAIPCCSHALSGARYRYPVSKQTSLAERNPSTGTLNSNTGSHPADSTMLNTPESENNMNDSKQSHLPPDKSAGCTEKDGQPVMGDLKALRAAKAEAASGADQSSMYACLTGKVIALAEELGIETERTLMRIPSTRNIGIIGGRRRRAVQKLYSPAEIRSREEEEGQVTELQNAVELVEPNGEALAPDFENTVSSTDAKHEDGKMAKLEHIVLSKIEELIERECRASGGVEASAHRWMERTKSLQTGQGRGKLNARKTYG